MRKWNLPLTYKPKIQPVIDGTCRQTIRIVNCTKAHPDGIRKQKGDLVRFFVWEGKPYQSKRKTITGYVPLVDVTNILISSKGWGISHPGIRWDDPFSDILAVLDGIKPPTGETLKNVLLEKNKIPEGGIEAQILRW